MVGWFREQERNVLRKVRYAYTGNGLQEGYTVADLTFDQNEESEKFGTRSVRYIQHAVELGAQGFFRMYGFRNKPQKGVFGSEEKKVQPRPRIEPSFDMADPGTVDFIRESSFDFWNDVHENTRADLIRELSDGMRAGETNRDIQKRVQGVFDGTTRGSAPRARMIARTEVNGAVNGGQWQAALQSDVVDRKQWLNAKDDEVRRRTDASPFTHRIAEVVKIKEVFTGTGESMRFPGDPRGSVGNRVNCRCVAVMLAYEVPEVETAVPPREAETAEEGMAIVRQEWEELLADRQQARDAFRGAISAGESEAAIAGAARQSDRAAGRVREWIYGGNTRLQNVISKDTFRRPDGSLGFTGSQRQEIRRFLRKFASLTDRDLWRNMDRSALRVIDVGSSRAAQSGSFLYVRSDQRVVWHEMAHCLEQSNPHILQAAKSFLNRRTAGETAERLVDLGYPGYSISEMVKKDRFRDPYVGKIYRNSTEVISMGIEQLQEVRMAEQFWQDDPEYFYFIMAVLRGRIPRR